jgi:acetyl-CoA carboxylase alpha subunit
VGEYAPVTQDWRAALLADATRVEVAAARRNPAAWPGYEPRPAVAVWRLARGPVAAVWDFTVYGGSFGEDDATALVEAARLAVAERRPLLTVVRSGGTRLQEGMAALVGIPRARLALLGLAAAGLPHLSVADAPTTGGVWISVASVADLRVAVAGATVGFAGPRVVEAVTGVLPAEGSHTAESAAAAGLVDAVLPGEQVPAWLDAALQALAPAAGDPAEDTAADVRPAQAPAPSGSADVPQAHGGWQQVQVARARTTSGAELLAALLDGPVALAAPRGDTTVAAAVGRLGGRPVVAVALAAELRGRPTPDGYRLATRAFRLAGRLGLPVLSLVDTPGAEPGTAAEEGGVAPAMGEALDALLTCPSPTLALVHGEGGSGGALAAAAADRVLVTPRAYFAAIGPEGAQAALRRPAQECADLMRITPADLLALGAADALVDDPAEVAAHLAQMSGLPAAARLVRRRERWSAPLPGNL